MPALPRICLYTLGNIQHQFKEQKKLVVITVNSCYLQQCFNNSVDNWTTTQQHNTLFCTVVSDAPRRQSVLSQI